MSTNNTEKEFTTINEIVQDLLDTLDEETKQKIREIQPTYIHESYIGAEHFGLGLSIRNKYGLWNYGNADDISGEIIERLIGVLKKNEPLDSFFDIGLRKIQEQNEKEAQASKIHSILIPKLIDITWEFVEDKVYIHINPISTYMQKVLYSRKVTKIIEQTE